MENRSRHLPHPRNISPPLAAQCNFRCSWRVFGKIHDIESGSSGPLLLHYTVCERHDINSMQILLFEPWESSIMVSWLRFAVFRLVGCGSRSISERWRSTTDDPNCQWEKMEVSEFHPDFNFREIALTNERFMRCKLCVVLLITRSMIKKPPIFEYPWIPELSPPFIYFNLHTIRRP